MLATVAVTPVVRWNTGLLTATQRTAKTLATQVKPSFPPKMMSGEASLRKWPTNDTGSFIVALPGVVRRCIKKQPRK
jgi:hypothetical protein